MLYAEKKKSGKKMREGRERREIGEGGEMEKCKMECKEK
jgi:hypothetical protein